MRRIMTGVCVGAVMATVASVIVADNALHIYGKAPDDALARAVGFPWKPAEVTATDGAVLRGWLFTPREPNGGAVILLHGVGDTRAGVLGHAGYLLEAGYAVLTPDSRDHGGSGGSYVTYGVKEAGDVHTWAEWLTHHVPVSRLYGMGESMGAAIILQSLAVEPRLRAVVAECPYATFTEVAIDRLSERGFPPRFSLWPVIGAGYLYARIRYGVDLRLASPLAAVRATHVPVLLIHGTADTNIPSRNSVELHAANPSATELWLVPGATHVNALAAGRDEYVRRVTGWFSAH